MALRVFAPLSALLFCLSLSTAAKAQLSPYAAPVLTAYGNQFNGRSTFKSDGGGILGGAFYNFPIDSRLIVGIDCRASYSPGGHGGAFVLGAARFGFVPNKNPLRPYFQIGGGVVTSNPPSSSFAARNTSGAAELAFGLDIRLNDRFDLRAPEFAAAAGGGSGTTPVVSFFTIGVVYHPNGTNRP